MANLKIIWTTGLPFSPASINRIGYETSPGEWNVYRDGTWCSQTASTGDGYRLATAEEIAEHWKVLHPKWTPEPGDKVIITQEYYDWRNQRGVIVEKHDEKDYWRVQKEDGKSTIFSKSIHMILAPYEETAKPTIPTPKEGYITIRLFTEDEFRSKGLWNSNGYPEGWNNDGEMNKYLGTYIQLSKSKFDGSSSFRYEDWHFAANNYEVIHDSVETKPEPKPETTSKPGMITVRFFTETEFKAKDLWSTPDNCPKGWVQAMNKYLGQTVDINKSNTKIDGELCYNGWTFTADDYEVLTLGYESKSSLKVETKEPEMKKQRFKVGDKVTYKSKDEFGGSYCHGGSNQGGYVGTIKSYGSYYSTKNCYTITVSTKDGGEYAMLESEFYEYDGIHPKVITSATSLVTDVCTVAPGTANIISVPLDTWGVHIHKTSSELKEEDNLARYDQAPVILQKKPKRKLIVLKTY